MKKLVNRVFALFFFIIIGLWVVWYPIWNEIENQSASLSIPFTLPFLIVLAGLLYEILHPSLNFKLDKNKKWKAIGIFLLLIATTVIIVEMFWQPLTPNYSPFGSITFEFPTGSGNIYMWPVFLYNFLSIICMETTSFSLLFGFLFVTKSTPQTSKSYKIMLFGAATLELLFFIFIYFLFFITGVGIGSFAGMTRIQVLTKYWFHWDFWSELVILISAIWLLKKGKENAPKIPWTPQEKRFVSIFIWLALFIIFVVSPIAMGFEPEKVFASLMVFALAIAGYILYLKYIKKKHKT